ncbi:hypothetical protein niasHT_013966 [Heterodera trifolii]|uniref:Uncharacterized protein n=1 Tax=Heterodera trifolii TaxID=157864 RepID=A0ABD2KLQ5_9BILA
MQRSGQENSNPSRKRAASARHSRHPSPASSVASLRRTASLESIKLDHGAVCNCGAPSAIASLPILRRVLHQGGLSKDTTVDMRKKNSISSEVSLSLEARINKHGSSSKRAEELKNILQTFGVTVLPDGQTYLQYIANSYFIGDHPAIEDEQRKKPNLSDSEDMATLNMNWKNHFVLNLWDTASSLQRKKAYCDKARGAQLKRISSHGDTSGDSVDGDETNSKQAKKSNRTIPSDGERQKNKTNKDANQFKEKNKDDRALTLGDVRTLSKSPTPEHQFETLPTPKPSEPHNLGAKLKLRCTRGCGKRSFQNQWLNLDDRKAIIGILGTLNIANENTLQLQLSEAVSDVVLDKKQRQTLVVTAKAKMSPCTDAELVPLHFVLRALGLGEECSTAIDKKRLLELIVTEIAVSVWCKIPSEGNDLFERATIYFVLLLMACAALFNTDIVLLSTNNLFIDKRALHDAAMLQSYKDKHVVQCAACTLRELQPAKKQGKEDLPRVVPLFLDAGCFVVI